MWDFGKLLSQSLGQKSPDLSALLEGRSDKVAALEELVKQLMATQHQVAGSLTERISSVPGLPKPMIEMTEQMHGMAESMLKLQAEIWSGWFSILRQVQGDVSAQPATKRAPTEAEEAKASEPAPEPEPEPLAEPVAAPVPEGSAAPAAASIAEEPAAPMSDTDTDTDTDTQLAPEPSAVPVVDDLKAITGVGPAIERKLNEAGVFSYQQIANWSDDDIDRIEAAVMSGRFVGRIRRDDWIGQAKRLLEPDSQA